ncbi:Asp23/Gls24 family envelope stress response protein [Candidatus Sumerlaeota bacterium]|nr:Asp23/Gls24 family envelope stress response protein [Candidatus Sumerlaeota bacterium]
MKTDYRDSQSKAMEEMLKEGPGRIDVHEEVFQTITAMETQKVEGVQFPEQKSWIGHSRGELKDLLKTVQIEVVENVVKSININIVVEYGYNVYECSRTLQRRIKNAVESITGNVVESVNITVRGLKMPEPKEPEVEETPKALPEKTSDEKKEEAPKAEQK